MHKRGFAGISETVSIFVLVILFVSFWLIFDIGDTFSDDAEEITAHKLTETKEYGFLFLQAPIIDELEMSFGDLVVKSVEGNNYAALEKLLTNEFDETEFYWVLVMRDSSNKLVKKLARKGWITKGGQRETGQEILIPGYKEGNLKIIIKITKGERFNQAIADYDDPSHIPRGSIGQIY
ncbi:hypothetical protein HOA88_00570 [Candidatus Woesearchaeota archaeon]|nr:hypothetical protein [Candidatus Woesearchaeota archaeon]